MYARLCPSTPWRGCAMARWRRGPGRVRRHRTARRGSGRPAGSAGRGRCLTPPGAQAATAAASARTGAAFSERLTPSFDGLTASLVIDPSLGLVRSPDAASTCTTGESKGGRDNPTGVIRYPIKGFTLPKKRQRRPNGSQAPHLQGGQPVLPIRRSDRHPIARPRRANVSPARAVIPTIIQANTSAQVP